MSLYTIALFFHIIGALLMVFVVGVILTGMHAMRRAQTVAQLRERVAMATSIDRLLPVATLLILLPAVYMVFSAWGWQTGWIDVALPTLIFMVILGPVFIGRRLDAVYQTALNTSDGPITYELHAQCNDPILWFTIYLFTCLTVGVVFLMANKPDVWGSLLTVVGAVIIALLINILLRNGQKKPVGILEQSVSKSK